MREVVVLGISCLSGGTRVGRLLIGCGEEKDTMEVLGTPAIFHEGSRKIIKQSPMNRFFRAHAEVTRRADQAFAKVMQPDAIDIDSCGERVFAAGNRSSQIQPTPPVAD